jgi:phosphoribosylamine--glycine ligase
VRVLIIGSGGREAALAWKIAQSSYATNIFVSPGNPGMLDMSQKIFLLNANEFADYLSVDPELVIIGPEAPLTEGIVDFFEERKIAVVGPTKNAARLESSKVFCKEIFTAARIPTAAYKVANNLEEAISHISSWKAEGIVVKVDELAQGKGVIVCSQAEEAIVAAKGFFDGSYLGFKVKTLLLEERLVGEEVSAFALCDGKDFLYLGSATDYKRLNDNDEGPNTGGMGTISPSPLLNSQDEEWIKENIFAPAMRVMNEKGIPFKGFLFAGLMKTPQGFIALEFNTRLGDPETQSLLPRITSDLMPLLCKAADGNLQGTTIKTEKVAIHVVYSAKGYPGVNGEVIQKADVITLGQLQPGTYFFPAAVTKTDKGLITSGGRICGLTVLGNDLASVHTQIYQETSQLKFSGCHFRKDIGKKFL